MTGIFHTTYCHKRGPTLVFEGHISVITYICDSFNTRQTEHATHAQYTSKHVELLESLAKIYPFETFSIRFYCANVVIF